MDHPPLVSDELKEMLYEIAPDVKIKMYEETGDVDFGYEIPDVARFRANFFDQKNGVSAVFRQIPATVLSFEDFDKLDAPLPPVLRKLAMLNRGLVVVTGPTGSGKSTTLAAMVDYANKNRKDHIITIEDPIEFVHKSKESLINHREVGMHTKSFSSALKGALREDPDIILVGEMRDRETVELGLSAAETGHLVLSTLHTIDAGQTINRILGMFDLEEQEQIRHRLSDTLRWIVSQRLAPKQGGGRQALLEIMGSNMRVQEAIIQGESEGKTFYEIIESSYPFGWRNFDQACIEAFENNQIDEESALAYCSKRGTCSRGLDNVKKKRGDVAGPVERLSMQESQAAQQRKPRDPSQPGRGLKLK